jgi:poly-gamma-glutamate capsule biosynthesis protein CapA/YwtB (metallophosphatase superfamily)
MDKSNKDRIEGQGAIEIVAVGDCVVRRDDPESIFEKTAPVLRKADITLGQLETNISNRGIPRIGSLTHFRSDPKTIAAYTYAGFDVMGFGGNNALDFGYDAFLDTIDLLKKNNIAVIGAGRNLAEAGEPAILERKSTRVAFLSYCSLLQYGYDAGKERPGVNPIKVSTFYEPVENLREQPGTPARIITIPNSEDQAAMAEGIRKAKSRADIVIAYFHWGVHFDHPLAMYQPTLGHAAIDAGADLVLGGHPHVLQAIEVYKGRIIFYSLGNFAFDRAGLLKDPDYAKGLDLYLTSHGITREIYFRRQEPTIIVRCKVSNKKMEAVSFYPALIDIRETWAPEIFPPNSPEGQRVITLLSDISQRFNTKFVVKGEEVVIDVSK